MLEANYTVSSAGFAGVDDMVDPSALGQWLSDCKMAIDLVRAGVGLLPKGPERDEAEAQVVQAEEALQRSEATVAKELGYHLCKCTFPPQIMLWDEKQNANVCPRAECGHHVGGKPATDAAIEVSGPNAWMAR
jgi:hypothetical protein